MSETLLAVRYVAPQMLGHRKMAGDEAVVPLSHYVRVKRQLAEAKSLLVSERVIADSLTKELAEANAKIEEMNNDQGWQEQNTKIVKLQAKVKQLEQERSKG